MKDTLSNEDTDQPADESGSSAPTCSAFAIGTEWIPKKRGGGLPWKVTDIYHSEMGRVAVQLEKYQGGTNSPAIITIKNLKKRFRKI